MVKMTASRFYSRLIVVICMLMSTLAYSEQEDHISDDIDSSGKNEHATILIYHHVSDSTPPSTSISPQRFRTHLEHLKQHHTVVSLTTLIEALQTGAPLPNMAVAITFDDGFKNVLVNAHPLLLEYGFPYTIFVNPNEVGSSSSHLTWQELKMMSQQGALIANHYWDHRHLLQSSKQEDWLRVTRQHILDAEKAIARHIGDTPGYLAYPFGEYNKALAELIKELEMVGFAQHSGGVGNYTSLVEVPRFPAAGIYANLDSLKVKISSLSMPVLENSIDDPAFYQPPIMEYSLTLDTTDFSRTQFTCYFKGEMVQTKWQGDMVTVNSEQTLTPGRSRTNCTAPSISKPGRYYWHSQPWFVADEKGKWLD